MSILHSIVIPAYNEEKRITKTLDEYISYFNKKGINYEIIVVCDGCTDKTTDIVKKMGGKNKKIKLFECEKRLGKGGGVYYGFSMCNGDTIGFTDADNAVGPQEYEKLIKNLENTDCVIASRRKKDSLTIVPQTKLWVIAMRIASRIFNF